MGQSQERLILVRFRPMWKHIDGIREFGSFFTRATFDKPELGDRVALAIHELTENAVKYSPQNDEAEMELSVHHDGELIEVTVANTPVGDGAEALSRALSRINEGPAVSAYLEAMKRAVELPDGQSGLGLARIRQESDMTLSMEEKDGLIRVSARGRI